MTSTTKPTFYCPCCFKTKGLNKRKIIKINLIVKPSDPLLTQQNVPAMTMEKTKTLLGKPRIKITKDVDVCVNCAVDTFVGTFPVKRVYRQLFTQPEQKVEQM
uniref:Uncharacterized protein n=1 Tax=Clandestinovirus TaxID=2831644 RepID=A0A8F8KNH1_9VIRU|nr:hypothetical protein KOM_12_116 [Clandestinovirus]